jgi:hypothetical protein
MKVRIVVAFGLTLIVGGLAGMAQAQPAPSRGQAALDAAAKQQKHLFILFWKRNDAPTQAMQQTLEAALAKRTDQASAVLVRATDPAEKPLIDRWGLSRSPMPLVLSVAPNGAITGGFPLRLTEEDVEGAIVSPGMAACLKATQSQKLALVCVHPAGSTDLPTGVRDFKADAQYGPATEIIRIRRDDAAEARFLEVLQIKPAATTGIAFLAPPASLLGTFDHTVTRQQLVDSLKAAQSNCCPGGKCGPDGCCPGGKGDGKK